ncbi:hypothetical protein B9Z19DRAFT_1134178 [Tuber borchii]|uniref:Plasma membrane fusion protein PRM1 n=1 Tax=Tuber borchii TaxID=42251 RepID=A0A2T6ZEK5_TUBBO|nr:hypothetical protein B9Z19DRAFT_1134178 [Tuber borchii]
MDVASFPSPSLDELKKVQIPTRFDDDLKKLKDGIPTFVEVKKAADDAIRIPFRLISSEFDRSMSPIPELENLTFCSSNPKINNFFDDLESTVSKVKKTLIGVIICLAILAVIPITNDKSLENKNTPLWSEQENARLINSKKRRIDRGTTEPQTIRRKFNGYTTPATPITRVSPTPRAPNISPPVKPRFRPSVVHSSPKEGGLFCQFPGLIAGDLKEGPEELTSSPLGSPPSSLSIPETQAPSKTFGVTQNSEPRDGGDSTESEDEPRSSDHYSGALNEPVLPSRDSAFKVPMIKKETDVCGQGHISQEELEAVENIIRPGWISGGFRIASTEDTGETQDTETDLPVLTFPLPTTGEGKPLSIRSDSHLARPTTPVGTARAEPGSSPPFSAPN